MHLFDGEHQHRVAADGAPLACARARTRCAGWSSTASSASVGAALAEPGDDVRAALCRADQAMYTRKGRRA